MTREAPGAGLRIGVLALQGAFREHLAALRRLGVEALEVRTPPDLAGLDGLVLPGGESTAIDRLLDTSGLRAPLVTALGTGLPAFGTCAGLIVLSAAAEDGRPDQRPLGLIDLTARRNGFGRQVHSFEAAVTLDGDGERPMTGVFIRAPRIVRVGDGVEVLGTLDGEPVVAAAGGIMVASFHPELTGDDRLHQRFLERVRAVRALAASRGEPPSFLGSTMSGHSKWSTIKHKKAATDKKRGVMFSKLSRAIIVAAKDGGGDPTANNALATAIQKARDFSMPKDNIERAIQRGAGGGDANAYESVTYEGYGAGGAAFVVEALTDNRNRTAANVRSYFAKHGGALGQPGSVAWMFDRRGVVIVEGEADEDELTLAAADAGAEDVALDGDVWQVTCDPGTLAQVRSALEGAGFEVASAELTLLPKNRSEVDDDTAERLLRMVDLIEDDDDVQDVYFNFEIPESVLEG